MAAASPSLAQEPDCRDPQTQTDMSLCAAQAYKKADDGLNAVYKQLRQRNAGNDDAKAGLLTAQRAWIVFRDAECDLTALGVRGGSAYPMVRAMCLETLTLERTRQLEDRLNCKEGDLSC